MKKVAIVSLHGTTAFGGVERVAYYLDKILSERYEVEVLEMKYSIGKFNVVFYPIWFSILLWIKKYDVVISNTWHACFYPADVVICHGTTKGNMEQVAEDRILGARYIAVLEGFAFRLAKHIWAVSGNSANEVVRLYHVGESKISVFNNFVNDEQFYPVACDKIEPTKCRILFVGRLINRKGAEKLYELAKYIEKLDNVCLIVACNDSTGVSRFSELKHTKIMQGLSYSQMRDFYKLGDVFYFPTKYEGFSMSVLESLCCGIPVIGSLYALPDEFNGMQYTKRVSTNMLPQEIVGMAEELKAEFSDKKNEINSTVKEQFGKYQYKTKLFSKIEIILKQKGI